MASANGRSPGEADERDVRSLNVYHQESGMTGRNSKLLLLIVPVGLLILSHVMMGVRGPYNLGLNIDPEYQYLLNSSSLASGKLSVYVHHPGTPLQVLASAVIFSKWLLGGFAAGWPPVVEAVAADHLGYLRTINIVLVLLLAAATWLAGWQIHRQSGSMLAAFAGQLTPLLFMPAVEALPRVAPELPELILGMALFLPLAPLLMGPEPREAARRPWLAIAAGFLVGLAIATKANCILLLLLAMLFAGWRQWLRFTASAVVTFGLAMLPVAFALRAMWTWFTDMATHTGHYGEGAEGLPTLDRYLADLGRVFENEPFLLLFLIFYAVVLAVSLLAVRDEETARFHGVRKMLALGTGGIVLHTLITAKHFNYHYILPAIMLAMLLNSSIVYFLGAASLRRRHLQTALVLAGVLLVYEGATSNWNRMSWYSNWKQEYRDHIATVAAKRAKHSHCRILSVFRSSAPTFALAFGNSMAGIRHHAALEELYPGKIHVLSGRALPWDHEDATEQLQEEVDGGACVLLQGEVASNPSVEGFELEPVYVPENLIHGAEGLYRLTTPPDEGEESDD
jgi:hypothetical protein